MAMIFDTLKLSKSLRDAEFSERQANALAAALSEQARDTTATKADLLNLEMKLGEKIAEVRAGMTVEFSKVRTEISSMKAETIKWIVAAIAFNIAANAGLFKLFAR